MYKKKAKLNNDLISMTQRLDRTEETYFSTGQHTFSSRDISRLMLQTLHNLGYKKTLKQLEEESGLKISSDAAELFFSKIQSGDLQHAIDLSELLNFDSKSRTDVVNMLLELKYFEYIRSGNLHDALACLRYDLRKYVADPARLTFLATSLLTKTSVRSGDNDIDFQFYCTREAVISCLRRHISPEEMVGEFRLEELIGEALQWQYSDTPPPRPVQRGALCSSLLRGVVLPEDDHCSNLATPIHTVAELCHHCEVWCIAFSPDGKMLATAAADGSVKLWLSDCNQGEALPGCCFSRAVECKGSAEAPILLRWDSYSSSFLCCCQDSNIFFQWDVSKVNVDESLSGLNCTSYDQSYEIVFADYMSCPLPSASSECSDLLISCTRESHIFVCDLKNNLLHAFVGEEECGVVAALLVSPCASNSGQRQMGGQGQVSGWRKQSKTAPSSCFSNTRSREVNKLCSVQHTMLVANSKNNEITLFHILISCEDNCGESRQVYEIMPTSKLLAGSPIVSLAGYNHLHDCSGGSALALVMLLGGNVETLSLSIKGGKCSRMYLTKNDSKRVSQSRFVVRPSMDPSGRYIACGGEDGVVRVWDQGEDEHLQTKQEAEHQHMSHPARFPPRLLAGHCGHVGDVSWAWRRPTTLSFSNAYLPFLLLASASDDGTVRVWASLSEAPQQHYSCQTASAAKANEYNITEKYETIFCGGTRNT